MTITYPKKNEESKDLTTTQVFVGLAIIVPGVLWSAFVASVVWKWFAPDSWPVMTLQSFLLLSLIAALYKQNKTANNKDFNLLVGNAIIIPALILIAAFVCKLILLGW